MAYQIKLYHYVHCPYCIRVRMAFGHLKIPFQSLVTPYDDEKTPIGLCGKKMLPIIEDQDGAMNESLDIIKKYAAGNLSIPSEEQLNELENYLSDLGQEIHSLAMPYIIWTPEFNDSSRAYFQNKKEAKRGPFKDLMKNQPDLFSKLEVKIEGLAEQIQTFYQGAEFSLQDIMIASHLWALFLVPEYQFPEKIYSYLMRVKAITHFDYHLDYKR